MEVEAEVIAKRERRQELRNANLAAWKQGKPDPSLFKGLDSNIKKNTGFIKKCKSQLSAEYQQQLLKDIKTLTLEKYISEVVVAVVEGAQKCKATADVWAAVEVISALHQRFPDTFTPFLTATLTRSLAPPNKQQLAILTAEQREKEEGARIMKQRILLRIAGELWLLGVLRNVEEINGGGAGNMNGVGFTNNSAKESKESKETKSSVEGFMYTVLKDLLSHDSKHTNLPLAVSFIKYFGPELIGTIKKKRENLRTIENEDGENNSTPHVANGNQDASPENEQEVSDCELVVPASQRNLFKNLLIDYFKGVEKHLIKDHQKIKSLDHNNHEYYITKGEVPEETKQNYEKVVKAFEKFLQNAQTLADYLEVDMPDLPEDERTTKIGVNIIRSGSSVNEKEDNFNNSVWEDEDMRSFYETLIDLKTHVPGVLLESKPGKKDEAEAEKDELYVNGNEKDDKEEDEKLGEDNQIDDAKTKNTQEANTETAEKISEEGEINGDSHSDKDDVGKDGEKSGDQVGIEAPTTKRDKDEASNKSGTSAQLDSLLSRLPNMINRDLIDQAAIDFCYLNSKMSRRKLFNVLVAVPRARLDLLPYYSRLIATLNPHYPDISTAVLKALEDEFKSLQKKKTLELQEKIKVLLDDFAGQNIDIACNLLETCGRFLFKSPETSIRMGNMLEILMRKKSVQHLDNRQLLMVENAYYQCNPPDRTAMVKKERSIMEQFIRKLIYSDLNKKTVEKVLKLLRKLNWDDKEVFKVLEKCFSKVFKIKYSNIHLMAILASGLHRYHSDFGVSLVDRVIEDIRIGLEQNIFKHNQRRIATVKYLGELYNYRMVDSPVIFDTLYSIVTLGHEFGRPSPVRVNPLDAPSDFFRIRLCCTLLDTCGMCFDRGSSKKRLDDFLVFFQMYILTKQHLPMDVEFMIADLFETLRPDMILYKTYEDAAEEVDQKLMLNQKVLHNAGGGAKREEEGSDDEQVDSEEIDEGNEEDEIVVHTNRPDKVNSVDDDEFEREFSKMMTESMESRKYERKPAMLDVAIPMHLKGVDRATDHLEGSVSFTLLTKKGNKQQMKTMEVPAESALAVNTRTKQEAEREEQQQLKKLVLNYEEREEQNQRIALEQSLINNGVKVSYQSGNRRANQRGRKLIHQGGGHTYVNE
ncbi:15191_t:CDS:10, partial [Acaulospora morrowiae]